MHHKEILTTLDIAHRFGSAFTREELHQYLRFKIDRRRFHAEVETLIRENVIREDNGLLFVRNMQRSDEQRRRWSQAVFRRNRKYLVLLSKMPWVKYIGLTGANSFESCSEEDDLDLFIVTASNRLWLCYVLLVLLTKAMRKRETLCINYLVDEANLEIREKNHFTAIQIIQMIPVYDPVDLQQRLVRQNEWIFNIFPNANPENSRKEFYWVGNGKLSANGKGTRRERVKLLAGVNRKLYRKYADRLRRKFPEVFGAGIMLSEGLAKLNRIDNQDIYGDLLQQSDEGGSS